MATVHSPVYLESTPFWVTLISLDSSDHQRMTQLEGKDVGQSPWTSLSNKLPEHSSHNVGSELAYTHSQA